VDAITAVPVRARRLSAIVSIGPWVASVPFSVDPEYVSVVGGGGGGGPIGVAVQDAPEGGVAEIALAGAVSVFSGITSSPSDPQLHFHPPFACLPVWMLMTLPTRCPKKSGLLCDFSRVELCEYSRQSPTCFRLSNPNALRENP
jgi:hypothetical protein